MGVFAVAGLLAAAPSCAQGDLLVAPTRVIIDNRGTAEVVLSNVGDKEATYRISVQLKRMTEDGSLEEVDDKDANATEKAAEDMIRYFPRQVVLPPGQPQVLRVTARPLADLPDGEYRIHLSFNGLPPVAPVGEQAQAGADQQLKIQLIPVYSIAIPIIIRKGNLEATAAISNPQIEQRPDGPALELDMARSGTASVFGEIRVVKPGQSDPVFLARGIAIYPEITHRKLALPLTADQAAAMKGPVKVEYRELPENGGGLLASVEGTLG
ncbi:MAG TPA: molecular chaperone [Sphingomonadaceae bacterium]